MILQAGTNLEDLVMNFLPRWLNVKLNLSPSPVLGFHGYLLEGKLDSPKLWSAEQVSSSLAIAIDFLFSHLNF